VHDGASWSNWAGNQHFTPGRIATPRTEREVLDFVAAARGAHTTVRAAGSGHSFTPIVQTDGTLLDLSALSGVVSADPSARRATVRAGTRLRHLGAPLWQCGLALANQGDYDAQTISGLTATGTKGSGTAFGCISSTICAMRLATGTGELLDIDASQPDLLHAAQVSLGLLGVVTQLTFDLLPAYRIRESNAVMTVEEVLDRWEDSCERYRHFSFFWMPTDTSHRLYGLPPIPAGHCYVKMLHQEPYDPVADTGAPVTGEVGQRVGRAHIVYPDVQCDDEATFDELEYMVPAKAGKDAFLSMRTLMQRRYPREKSPVQIRFQRGGEAFLSAQYRRDTVSVSVSGYLGTDYTPFLQAVDVELQQFDARPHWGKAHFLTPERVRALYPALDQFLSFRRELDPDGVFLNHHFKYLFGI
jgi:FAD/FMN-containing dehydrogenase